MPWNQFLGLNRRKNSKSDSTRIPPRCGRCQHIDTAPTKRVAWWVQVAGGARLCGGRSICKLSVTKTPKIGRPFFGERHRALVLGITMAQAARERTQGSRGGGTKTDSAVRGRRGEERGKERESERLKEQGREEGHRGREGRPGGVEPE